MVNNLGPRMLPQANASFSLPSLYDGTEVKCRLYFPRLRQRSVTDAVGLTASGVAIFAHPYAPLGGSFDDPVVQLIGKQLLKENLLLLTFNFRGAEGSEASTSWSAKPELADYATVYAFTLAFMNDGRVSAYLARARHHDSTDRTPLLLLGGYSYGSMIASHLPTVDVLVEILGKSQPGSPEHEVTTRAIELAQVVTGYFETHTPTNTPATSSPAPRKVDATIGGSQSLKNNNNPDTSHFGHLHMRTSIDRVRRKLCKTEYDPSQEMHDISPSQHNIVSPELAYLLVSPLLGPVSSLAAAFSILRFERYDRKSTCARDTPVIDPQKVLGAATSFVVFGGHDQFTSSRKVRKWCEAIAMKDSKFEFREVADASHFWFEENSSTELEKAVSSWLKRLID